MRYAAIIILSVLTVFAEQRPEVVLNIAEGKLLESGAGWARYEIINTHSGVLGDRDITVTYFPNSISKNGLPTNAVLILRECVHIDGLGSVYEAYGGDAARSVLQNSEANLIRAVEMAKGISEGAVIEEERIECAKAISIVFSNLAKCNIQLPAGHVAVEYRRYEYGWVVRIKGLHGHLVMAKDMFYVGDDGVLKDPLKSEGSRLGIIQ